MIRVESAQNVISTIHTKYDQVHQHTSNALVCIETNLMITVEHDSFTLTNIYFQHFKLIKFILCNLFLVMARKLSHFNVCPTFKHEK